MKNKHPEYMTSGKERLSYWTYFVGQNIYYNITAAFISTYLAMQGVSLAKVAFVLLIVKVWDAVNDPIFGFIFDKVKFKKDKSLPWLRIAVTLIPVVTIILFAVPSGLSETGKLIWFGLAYVAWDTVYTLTDVPAYAMLNTMTDNLEERNLLLSVNRVFSGVGVVIYGVALPLLISESVGMSASMAVAILAVFSAITMIPLCVNCKERNYKPEEEDENFTPKQMFTYLKSNKYLLTYYAGYMVSAALSTSSAVLLFVAFYLFGNSLYSIVLNFLNMVPGVFAAMAMPALLKRFDKFKTLFVCNIINIVLGLVIYYGGYCAMDALKTSTALGLFASFYLFGSSMFNMLLGFLSAVPGFIAAFLAPKIVKKFDKMKVLMICNLLNVLFGFAIFFCGWENKTLFIILNVLRAAPASIQGVLAFMFTPDCAEYGQYKSGVSATGITFAIQTFSVKITAAISSSLALFLLGCFNWISVQASDFAELQALNVQQSAQAINGLWIVYALIPTIGLLIAGICYLFYKLNDKDVQIMAKCNSGEITREEAEKLLSRKY